MKTSSITQFKKALAFQDPRHQSLGIRGRLFIGFGVIALILILSIALVLVKVTEVRHFADHVIHDNYPASATSYDLGLQIKQATLSMQAWLLTQNKQFKIDLNDAWNNIQNNAVILDQFAQTGDTGDFAKGWQKVKLLLPQLKATQEKVLSIPDPAAAKNLYFSEEMPLINQIFDILDGPLNAEGNRVGGIFDHLSSKNDQSGVIILNNLNDISLIEYFLLGVSTLLCVIIAFYTTRGLLKYVGTFRQQSNLIAAGDLTQRITVSSKDELGLLGEDLNTMTDSLANITKQITEGCHHIVSTLDELRHSVDTQSSGASEQASSINQITASLAEIEKSSTQTLDKTKTLGEAAQRTQEKGELGLDAVEQSIAGMKTVREKVQMIAQTILALSNKTQQIGEITSVVNSLAQQSKMLALNASIEAAKAGEAGKGFAVVAEEVKNLAEQSEQSTTQVQKIIEDIRHATEKAVMATEEGTKGVDQGTGLVEQTGDIVRSLSEVIHEATIATQQIEAAVRQESVGIEQITTGMNEINQVTTSFVESVKQTTEAVSHLSGIAKNLKENVDVYKI